MDPPLPIDAAAAQLHKARSPFPASSALEQNHGYTPPLSFVDARWPFILEVIGKVPDGSRFSKLVHGIRSAFLKTRTPKLK